MVLQSSRSSKLLCGRSFLVLMLFVFCSSWSLIASSSSSSIPSSSNLFASVLGKNQIDIDSKVNEGWHHFFEDTTNKLYVESGTDMAYIYTGEAVITEGQSYGMMISVQLNKKTQFDKLWTFAKRYMQHTTGVRAGYFSWKVKPDGTVVDPGSAPDGEEYFVTSLFFASARWGNGAGIYNYEAEAKFILNAMIHLPDNTEGITKMFDPTHQLVVFAPVGGAAKFTDPSYHLPHFYMVWSQKASQDNQYWATVATKSRQFLQLTSSKSPYGLFPDYANWDGTATTGGLGPHDHFQWDAWRVVMNIGLDYSWFGNTYATDLNQKLLSFFKGKGVNYASLWDMNANSYPPIYHATGLVACNGAGTLAVKDQSLQTFFLNQFWNAQPPTGYYDGMLYMLSLLAVTGNYKFYGGKSVSNVQVDNSSIASDETMRVTVQLVAGIGGSLLVLLVLGFIYLRYKKKKAEIV